MAALEERDVQRESAVVWGKRSWTGEARGGCNIAVSNDLTLYNGYVHFIVSHFILCNMGTYTIASMLCVE